MQKHFIGGTLMQQRIPLISDDSYPLAALPTLPTMDDLPSENPEEPGLPDEFHDLQPQLLSRTLRLSGYSSQDIYTASDLNLYYDLEHLSWYKRPDWFLSVGVPRLYEGKCGRSSYVMWQEKVTPSVIVEFLSPGTEAEDLGRFAPNPIESLPNQPPIKFQVYEQILKVPNYVVFDRRDSRLRYFRLTDDRYQEQACCSADTARVAATNPRLWIPELEIGLAIWDGIFEGMPQSWLRWCDAAGEIFPTDTEAALAEIQRLRSQTEEQVKQTVLNLLDFGMPIAQVAQMTGLSEREVEAIASNAGK
jgi:Uma2 family endonuclease